MLQADFSLQGPALERIEAARLSVRLTKLRHYSDSLSSSQFGESLASISFKMMSLGKRVKSAKDPKFIKLSFQYHLSKLYFKFFPFKKNMFSTVTDIKTHISSKAIKYTTNLNN